jgi:hypothetical protein
LLGTGDRFTQLLSVITVSHREISLAFVTTRDFEVQLPGLELTVVQYEIPHALIDSVEKGNVMPSESEVFEPLIGK